MEWDAKCSLCGTGFKVYTGALARNSSHYDSECPTCHGNIALVKMLKAVDILEKKADEIPSIAGLDREAIIYRTIAKALRGEE